MADRLRHEQEEEQEVPVTESGASVQPRRTQARHYWSARVPHRPSGLLQKLVFHFLLGLHVVFVHYSRYLSLSIRGDVCITGEWQMPQT